MPDEEAQEVFRHRVGQEYLPHARVIGCSQAPHRDMAVLLLNARTHKALPKPIVCLFPAPELAALAAEHKSGISSTLALPVAQELCGAAGNDHTSFPLALCRADLVRTGDRLNDKDRRDVQNDGRPFQRARSSPGRIPEETISVNITPN